MISFTSLASGLLSSAIPLSLLLIGATFLFFVILPYKKVCSYKQEGVSTYFFPILGLFRLMFKSFKEKGDEMAEFKEASRNIANPKYIVTNVNTSVMIFLQDPKYIKEFLLNQTAYNKATFADVLLPLIGNGLVSAEGETWKRHRKIISSSFNFEFLKTNLPVIQNATNEFFNKLSADDLKNYSAISRIQDITGEIVGRIFFGENLNSYTCEGKSLTLALAEITGELAKTAGDPLVIMLGAQVLRFPLIPKYRKIIQRVENFRRICFEIIKDRKASPSIENNDLLSSLLLTQKSDDIEKRFSDQDIVDEFVTFFIAGMDTTGHLIGMTLYNLTQYPEYLEQLQAERDRTYNIEKELTTDTLYKMEVLHAVLKETLRFHTPAPMPFIRRALHDHNLADLKVKKGDLLAPSFLTPAFDENYFENPQQFNPSRWMTHESKIDSYAFTPFSAGPRNCIGQHLAIIEAKVIMSEFLERFEFELKEGYKLKMTSRFLYEPEDELILTLKPKVM